MLTNTNHWSKFFDDGPLDIMNFDLPITRNGYLEPLFEEFDDFGFKDKGNHYEMVTNLGGQKDNAGDPVGDVKIELTGKDGRTVEISYEHKSDDKEHGFYHHSQTTRVTLPHDADAETVRAYFDKDDNIVISVKKKSPKMEKSGAKEIPISRKL